MNKAAESLSQKRLKGIFALEDITLHVDPQLLEQKGGGDILTVLQDKQPSASLGAGRNCEALPGGYRVKIRELSVRRTVEFSRKVYIQFNQGEEGGGAETCIEEEIEVVIVRVSAKEFCTCVKAGEWETRVSSIQEQHLTKRLVFLLEGLEAYVLSIEQQAYGGAVGLPVIKKDQIQQICTWMRLRHSFDVHQVVNATECGQHIAALASSLARNPFRQSATAASFSTHRPMRGQGLDEVHSLEIAWISMLMQIPKVTEEVARAVSFAYPSFASLMGAYSDLTKSDRQKEILLQDLKRTNGNAEARRLGPALSKRIYRVFTSGLASETLD